MLPMCWKAHWEKIGRSIIELLVIRGKDGGCGQYKQMIGVDLNKERLKSSEEATSSYGVRNYTTICASVEEIPLRDNSFDKIIAIGIMPCIPNPTKLCLEANRLLKDNGELLISLPAPMYFKFTHFVANVARFIVRRKT